MNQKDKAEFLQLFSDMSGKIHRLSTKEAQYLMEVDGLIRVDSFGSKDLDQLREMSKAHS